MSVTTPTFGDKLVARIRTHLRSIGKVSLSAITADELGRMADEEWALCKPKRQARTVFVPPSPEEIEAYSASIGYPLNGEGWCAFYEAKDWFIGSRKMKSWQATLKKWKAMGWRLGAEASATQIPAESARGLEIELGRIERELEAILYPWGPQGQKVPPKGEKMKRYEELMSRRKAVKDRLAEIAQGGE